MGDPWKPGGPVRLSEEQFDALETWVNEAALDAAFPLSGRSGHVNAARQAARRALTGEPS